MKTDIVNTHMLRTGNSIRNRAVGQVIVVNTIDFICVGEGTIIRVNTSNTSPVVKNVSIKTAVADISRALETASKTELLLAEVRGTIVLIVSKDMDIAAAESRNLRAKKTVIARLPVELKRGNKNSL